MTTWNVRTAVVDLIDADTAEQAIEVLHQRLVKAGFEPYEYGTSDYPDAFESEEQA